MNKKPSVSSLQLLLMSVGSALVFPYTFLPILNTPPANQDVWAVLLLSFVYILALNAPLLLLMNKFRGHSMTETIELIAGKPFGKVLTSIFVLFFAYCFTACMLITAIFVNQYMFPSTPTFGILLYMVVPVAYASWKGAGTIGRLAVFVVIALIASVVLFFIFGYPKMNFAALSPILVDSSFVKLNMGAFLTASRYSEILIFWVFSYFLMEKYSINKTYGMALVTFGISFMLILLPVITVLGTEFAKRAGNPYYIFTRQVEAFGFLERLQSINTLAWFPGALLKLIMYNFMACFGLKGMFGAKSHKVFVIPVTAAGFIVALLPFMDNTATVELLRSDAVFPWVIVPIIFVVPSLLGILYLIRKKKVDAKLKQGGNKQEALPDSASL